MSRRKATGPAGPDCEECVQWGTKRHPYHWPCDDGEHVLAQPPRLLIGTSPLRGEWLVWTCQECGTAELTPLADELDRFLAGLLGTADRDGPQ